MLWIDTETDADAAARRSAMWGIRLTTDESGRLVGKTSGEGLYERGEFWAEAIKRVRHDPAQRLAMARRHLPLPAAFREAAIALRAIIKERRKAGDSFDGELRELHRLAAIGSLAPYDALDITPFATIQRLNLEPATLGWDKLPLLGPTDAKLMRESWDTPARHATAQELYPEVVASALVRLERHRENEAERRMDAIDRAFSQPSSDDPPAKRGLLARLFGCG